MAAYASSSSVIVVSDIVVAVCCVPIAIQYGIHAYRRLGHTSDRVSLPFSLCFVAFLACCVLEHIVPVLTSHVAALCLVKLPLAVVSVLLLCVSVFHHARWRTGLQPIDGSNDKALTSMNVQRLQEELQSLKTLRHIVYQLRDSIASPPSSLMQCALTQITAFCDASHAAFYTPDTSSDIPLEGHCGAQQVPLRRCYTYDAQTNTFTSDIHSTPPAVVETAWVNRLRDRVTHISADDIPEPLSVANHNVLHLVCLPLPSGECGLLALYENVKDNVAPAWSQTKEDSLQELGSQLSVCLSQQHLLAIDKERLDAILQQNAQLDQARINAERASEVQRRFLNVMSHELRTPLYAIFGTCSGLLFGNRSETEAFAVGIQLIQFILLNAELLLVSINNILIFVEMETARFQLQRQFFSPQLCLQRVVQTLAPLAQSKQLTLELITDPLNQSLAIYSDQCQIRQLFTNIVANAVKFTKQGGVTVRLDFIPADSTSDSASSPNMLRLSVTDSGVGMTDEQMSYNSTRLRSEQWNTRTSASTIGLGLPLSYQLVNLLGGSMEIRSEPGHGSTVTVHLPYEPVEDGESIPVPQFPSEEICLSALVVEDNLFNQMVTQNMLQKLGCKVTVVENGLEAVMAVRGMRYDVVVMDVNMPVMDGITATRSIVDTLLPHEKPWIIGLSANTSQQDREMALSAGMNDFVCKPARAEYLQDAVSRYFRYKNQRCRRSQ